MITINLRPGQKRRRSGTPLAAVGERVKAGLAKVKDPMLLVTVAAWIGVLGWLGYVWSSNARQMRELQPRLEQVRADNNRFKTFLTQKHKQELIRDSLLAQIGVIRGVDGDRYVWSHVLDEIARAVPAYTWLVDLGAQKGVVADSADTTAQPVVFQVTGRTVDIQAYTKFLRQLEASPWITDVTPVSAQTVVEKERAVTAFTIRANFRKADSAYIRTVPISQSVR